MLNFIISDVHFSRTKTLDCITDPMDEFIDILKSNNSSKRVIISGDFFDHGFSLSDVAYNSGITYLKSIFDLADEVLLLYGTTSHDRENYNPILKFLPPHVHFFKNIEKFTSSLDGFSFLMIPEEYPEDFGSYYSPYINSMSKYDLIIGHGNIDGAKMNEYVTIDNNRLGGRSFNKNDLGDASQETFFGHIHLRQNLLDNVQYVGSMNKTGFGEEHEVKGYWSFETNDTNMLVTNKSFHELKSVHNFIDIKSGDIDSASTLNPLEVRFVYDDEDSDFDIDMAKKLGFKIKLNKQAKAIRMESTSSKLKYEKIHHGMSMKDKFIEALNADNKSSKKLKKVIEREINSHF